MASLMRVHAMVYSGTSGSYWLHNGSQVSIYASFNRMFKKRKEKNPKCDPNRLFFLLKIDSTVFAALPCTVGPCHISK